MKITGLTQRVGIRCDLVTGAVITWLEWTVVVVAVCVHFAVMGWLRKSAEVRTGPPVEQVPGNDTRARRDGDLRLPGKMVLPDLAQITKLVSPPLGVRRSKGAGVSHAAAAGGEPRPRRWPCPAGWQPPPQGLPEPVRPVGAGHSTPNCAAGNRSWGFLLPVPSS